MADGTSVERLFADAFSIDSNPEAAAVVDRVAQILCADAQHWRSMPDAARQAFRARVRGLLLVMRRPDAAMMQAGAAVAGSYSVAGAIWQAMMDAALSGPVS